MKKVLIAIGAVLTVVVIAVIFVFSNLGELIKEAIQNVGSEATQASVTLDNVDLDITSGAGALKGLTIGNPKGFKSANAFQLGAISLSIDTGSVDKDPIVIREIRITGPEVTYEVAGNGNNLDAIKANVDTYAKKFGGGGSGESSGGGKKLIIENLYVTTGKVKVSAPFLDGKTLDASLPNLHLKDIGKEENGANPADVIKDLIDEMTKGATKAVAGLDLKGLAKEAGAKAREAAEGVAKGATDQIKSVTEGAGGEAGKSIGDGVDQAGEKLKGLFGK